jgi:ketosteroid isomerase-like protein
MRLTPPNGIMLMVPTVGEARVDKEEQAPVSTEEEKNKALVRRFLEARAAADVGVMDELLAPDFVDRSVLPGQGPSREDHIQGAVEDHAGISNLRLVIEGHHDPPHRGGQDSRGVERRERFRGAGAGAPRARDTRA